MSITHGFRTGDRVQIHPSTDHWMRGDRFGEIVAIGRLYITVALDRSGRTWAFSPADLEAA